MLRKWFVFTLLVLLVSCGGNESVEISLLAPGDGTNINTSYVTLQWRGGNASKYDLFLNSNGKFKLVARDIQATEYTVGPLKPGLYLWKVRAKGNDATEDSQVFSFVVKASSAPSLTHPKLLTPLYGGKVSGNVVEFSWKPATGATDIGYVLLVGDSPTDLKVVADSLAQTFYVYDVTINAQKIWWQVIAFSKNGGRSFSDKWFYYSGLATGVDLPPTAPEPLEPKKSFVSYKSSVILKWGKSIDPEGKKVKYNVYIGKSRDSLKLAVSNYTQETYIVSGLDADSVYYWRVEAVDVVGNVTRGNISWFYVRPYATQEKVIMVKMPESEDGNGCFLTNYGRLMCWSKNSAVREVPFSSHFSIEDFSITKVRNFAIDNYGDLWGWGSGSNFAIGNGKNEDLSAPEIIRNSENVPWYKVAAGYNHTCGIDINGALWCWGDNQYGETGEGKGFITTVSPFKFYWFSKGIWVDVGAGDNFTCGIYVINSQSKLYCWGDNSLGEIGVPGKEKYFEPVEVKNPHNKNWVTLSVAGKHICAIDEENILWCWGDNSESQIGVPVSQTPKGFQPIPRMITVGGVGGWKSVFTSEKATCAYDLNNNLWCWGYGGDKNSGDGFGRLMIKKMIISYPTRVSSKVVIKGLSIGYKASCMLGEDFRVYCWGDRSGNAIGDAPRGFADFDLAWNKNGYNLSPDVIVPMSDGICITSGNQLECWGENESGEFASGDTTPIIFPKITYKGDTWKSLSVPINEPGKVFVCGIDNSGSLYCWGNNDHGQLGTWDTQDRYFPSRVDYPEGVTWVQVATGFSHTCALDSNGNIWCWGDNSYYQAGTDSVSQVLVPYRVVTDTAFRKVAVVGYFTCGLNIKGEVLCWGKNRYGETGIDKDPYGSLPHMVRGSRFKGIKIVDISAGSNKVCVLGENQKIYCWGVYRPNKWINCCQYYRDREYSLFGVKWQEVKTGSNVTCGLSQDQLLYCWGDGKNLILGGDLPVLNSDGINVSAVLVKVGVAPGSWQLGYNTLCIKENGNLFCRGDVKYTGSRFSFTPYEPGWAEDISSLK